jgi:hypothetical protein
LPNIRSWLLIKPQVNLSEERQAKKNLKILRGVYPFDKLRAGSE